MNFINLIRKFPLYLKVLFSEIFNHAQVVKMSAFFNKNGSLQHLNWGDDINYWFLNSISQTPIVSYDLSLLTRVFKRKYVMGIGSLLTLVPLDGSIIWGSGIMSTTEPFRGRPKEIRAVRGPLTRNRLLDAGISCPEVYGDPALLLPLFYKSCRKKIYKLGIIPHYKDTTNPLFQSFYRNNDTLIIDVRNYNNWLDFIDEICSCDSIASTSLHGLIISEAYNIPNLWIKVPRENNEDDVKYHDFFLSIGVDRTPYQLFENTSLSDLLEAFNSYKKGEIDISPLIKSCPLKIDLNAVITH